MKILDRTGQEKTNYQGLKMQIIEYRNHRDITVLFSDGKKRKTSYIEFKRGSVKDLYFPSVYGVGYTGEEYPRKGNELVWSGWQHMMERCYNKNSSRYKFYGAIGVRVCEEWHNFSNYAKWYYDNCYDIDEPLSVDKDILNRDSKIYSPDTCIIIPRKINQSFPHITPDGKEKIPVYRRESGRYRARMNNYNIGTYDTYDEAVLVYKQALAQKWASLIEGYRGRIPDEIFEVLIKAI